jgi:hypothetical protein
MKTIFLSLLIGLLSSAPLLGDAGVLIPRDKQQPNPAILSLEEMEITVRIDNGDARVFVRQVFANHTSAIEEGITSSRFPAMPPSLISRPGTVRALARCDSRTQTRRRNL